MLPRERTRGPVGPAEAGTTGHVRQSQWGVSIDNSDPPRHLVDYRDPLIARSAFKHEVHREDILHAFAHPVRQWTMEEEFTMYIGGTRAGALLEIGVVRGHLSLVIVHAMPARPTFIR